MLLETLDAIHARLFKIADGVLQTEHRIAKIGIPPNHRYDEETLQALQKSGIILDLLFSPILLPLDFAEWGIRGLRNSLDQHRKVGVLKDDNFDGSPYLMSRRLKLVYSPRDRS